MSLHIALVYEVIMEISAGSHGLLVVRSRMLLKTHVVAHHLVCISTFIEILILVNVMTNVLIMDVMHQLGLAHNLRIIK